MSKVMDDLGLGSGGDEPRARAVVLMAMLHHRRHFRRLKSDRTGELMLDQDGDYIDDSFGFVVRLRAILGELARRGAVLVTGAGNDEEKVIDGWPAGYAKSTDPNELKELTVVGAVDPTYAYPFDKGNVEVEAGLPHIYAPGWMVTSAEGSESRWRASYARTYYRTSSGTSQASAATAGLAAYYLRLMQLGRIRDQEGNVIRPTPKSVKEILLEKSWSRAEFGGRPRPAIFNGVSFDQPICQWPDNPGPLPTPRPPEVEVTSMRGVFAEEAATTSFSNLTIIQPTPSATSVSGGSCILSLIPTSGSTASPSPSSSPSESSGSTTSPSPSSSPSESPSSTTSPSPSPSPSEPPKVPLKVNPPVCRDEDDYPGHADVWPGDQYQAAGWFCFDDVPKSLGPDEYHYWETTGHHGVRYAFEIEWVDGCRTETETQDPIAPLDPGGDYGPQCLDLLRNAYKECNNGGVGGYIVVGCLRYEFWGAY